MNEGKYTLMEQRGGKGYYGTVRLTVNRFHTPRLTITFDDERAAEWRTGVTFGITYAYEAVSKDLSGDNGIDVHVLEITGQPMDTNSLVISFVAAQALWKALNWTPTRPPQFDMRTGCFTFPKMP